MKQGDTADDAVDATLAEWQEIAQAVLAEIGARKIAEDRQIELQAKVAAAVLRGTTVEAAASHAVGAWTDTGKRWQPFFA